MANVSPGTPARIPAWAHAAGLLDLGPGAGPASLEAGIERATICERVARYCWSYDERRAEHLAACFTEDAVWTGNVLGAVSIGPFYGRERIVAWLTEFWPHQRDQRRHMILNTIVEDQREATATTLSYLILTASTGEAVSVETTGFYRASLRREGDSWRIAHLLGGFDKPFWPGALERLSAVGRARHGIDPAA